MSAVGRNEKCPCGSGHKYKHCCGATNLRQRRSGELVGHEALPPAVLQQFSNALQRESERRKKFGHAGPVISIEHGDLRIVAVGKSLRWTKKSKWQTVHDFLGDYIKQCIGGDWGNAELQKAYEDRSPVIQWYRDVCDLQRATIKESGKVHTAVATGPTLAYLSLAYDLYMLEHSLLLHKKLIDRLKINAQFQGARYEISVAAAFIRAGFDIQLEDEDDSTTSHCEFSAVHRGTGARFSVEAKSRSRPGILGKPGTPQSTDTIKIDIYRLLQGALKKRANYDRLVFIDVNMPPASDKPFDVTWLPTLRDQIQRMEMGQEGKDPWPPAFVFLTNRPYHFVDNTQTEPGRSVALTTINMPQISSALNVGDHKEIFASHPAVEALFSSIVLHQKIPHEFN